MHWLLSNALTFMPYIGSLHFWKCPLHLHFNVLQCTGSLSLWPCSGTHTCPALVHSTATSPCTGNAHWQIGSKGTDGTVRTQSCDCPPASNRGCRGAPPLWRALQWNSPPLVPVLPLSPLLLPHLFTPDWKWLSINDNPVDPSWLREDKIFYLILHSLCCPGWKWHQILITKAKKLWKANKVFIETLPPYSALNANINWFPKLDRSGGKLSRYFTDCGFVLLGSHRPSNADLAISSVWKHAIKIFS